jgi:hypothetical protein
MWSALLALAVGCSSPGYFDAYATEEARAEAGHSASVSAPPRKAEPQNVRAVSVPSPPKTVQVTPKKKALKKAPPTKQASLGRHKKT